MFLMVCMVNGVAAKGRSGAFGALLGSETPATAVEATPEAITFVDVPVGEKYSQSVRLSNTSAMTLKILKITPSAVDMGISGAEFPAELAAGGSLTFNVSYRPKAAGSASGTVFVTTSGALTPVAIGVRASAITNNVELTASDASLDFDDLATGSRSTKEISLSNTGNGSMAISKIVVSGEGFSASGGAVTLGAGQKISVQVAFEGTGIGSRSGMVSVFSNAPNSPLQIPLSGTISAASPQTIALKWEKGENAVNGYLVYRSNQSGGPYTKLQNEAIAAAEFTDSGLAAGHTYYYVVTSLDANNIESDYSEQIVVKVPEV